jgi:hypothetical protein
MSTQDSNHCSCQKFLLALASAGLASVLSLASLSLPPRPEIVSGHPYTEVPSCTR